MIRFTSMYEVKQSIGSIEDVRSHFPEGRANPLNWCFFSTSGVHGSYATLDDLDSPDWGDDQPHLTVVIVQPRTCVIHFGNILARPEDRPWLRELAASTIEAVGESQRGNLP